MAMRGLWLARAWPRYLEGGLVGRGDALGRQCLGCIRSYCVADKWLLHLVMLMSSSAGHHALTIEYHDYTSR